VPKGVIRERPPMSDGIELRLATDGDAAEVAHIWMEGLLVSSGLLAPPEQEVIASFRGRICKPVGRSAIWVATCGDEITGWQGLQDFGITQISRIAQSSTYVSKSWHGRGVGRKLLVHAQSKAREHGFDVIAGWIKTDNESSLKLVRSLNWKFVGILPRTCDSDPEFAYFAYAVPKKSHPEAH
jgi:L-amino acid N-acyltransferase YncA